MWAYTDEHVKYTPWTCETFHLGCQIGWLDLLFMIAGCHYSLSACETSIDGFVRKWMDKRKFLIPNTHLSLACIWFLSSDLCPSFCSVFFKGWWPNHWRGRRQRRRPRSEVSQPAPQETAMETRGNFLPLIYCFLWGLVISLNHLVWALHFHFHACKWWEDFVEAAFHTWTRTAFKLPLWKWFD